MQPPYEGLKLWTRATLHGAVVAVIVVGLGWVGQLKWSSSSEAAARRNNASLACYLQESTVLRSTSGLRYLLVSLCRVRAIFYFPKLSRDNQGR